MAHPLSRTLLGSLEDLRIMLTRPGFEKMLVVFVGWVRTAGTHAVTEALVTTGVADRRHHEAFHRFFSRGTWQPDRMGFWLFQRVLKLLDPGAPVCIVIDDTLAPKKGAHVFGLGSHIDAVRSTAKRKVFCFGHCWVVLAVVVTLPAFKCTFALPLLFRLYINKKTCLKKEVLLHLVWVVSASSNGDGDGFAFPCGQARSRLTTGKPPPPDTSPLGS